MRSGPTCYTQPGANMFPSSGSVSATFTCRRASTVSQSITSARLQRSTQRTPRWCAVLVRCVQTSIIAPHIRADHHLCRSQVLEKLGRRRDALELYERACVLAPESPAVRFKRVRILIHLKRFEVSPTVLRSPCLLSQARLPSFSSPNPTCSTSRIERPTSSTFTSCSGSSTSYSVELRTCSSILCSLKILSRGQLGASRFTFGTRAVLLTPLAFH